jgi:glycosyltransferase involved in cell wall biosynthesis
LIRVAFIIESERSAAARYRVLLNMDAFERECVDVYPMPYPRTFGGRRKMAKDLASFDAVVLQRRLIQPWEFLMLRRRVKLLSYDFDDSCLYRDSVDRGHHFSIARMVKLRVITRYVDFVTAGNPYLASLCGRRPGVSIIPTPVDTAVYLPAPKPDSPVVRLGWIGSRSTVGYLNEIIPSIEAVVAARPNVTLAVIADVPPPERPFINFVPWREESEPAAVAAFDIGLMPLPDNPWTRGKCGFKLLLYGACGLPSVASPVGANKEIIADGETGLLASTPSEWTSALTRLIDDAALRRRLGAAARLRIDAQYSSRVVIPQWAGILKAAVLGSSFVPFVRSGIAWARSMLGSAEYRFRCLGFVEDAYEISNNLELFGRDTAKESAVLYGAADTPATDPPLGAFVFYDYEGEIRGERRNWGHVGLYVGAGRIIHSWDRVRIDDYRNLSDLTRPPGFASPSYIGWAPVERIFQGHRQK